MKERKRKRYERRAKGSRRKGEQKSVGEGMSVVF